MRFLITFAILSATACGTTGGVFVKTDDVIVRIGPPVVGKIYFRKDGEWVLSKNKVKLPEGWYAGAPGGDA